MTSLGDWLPSNHDTLFYKSKQTTSYITDGTNRTRMGFAAETPQGEWLDLTYMPRFLTFITSVEDWQNPSTRTSIIITALADAQKSFTEVYRTLYTGFLKNSPLVTDVDLVAMGLPARSDGKHTPAQVPMTIPEAEIRLPGPGVVEIHFHDSGAERKAKPAGVHGVEIAWAILETAPVNWSELTQSSFDTRTPFTLTFEGDRRGKLLYFALRWENTRGDKGHWSNIKAVIIP